MYEIVADQLGLDNRTADSEAVVPDLPYLARLSSTGISQCSPANTRFLDRVAVLAIYLVGVVGFGCWFAWRSNSSDQYMSAGRSIPGWAVGMSIFGSYISSISFMANPGKAYSGNWNPFVFALSMPLGIWISVKYFVPFYRLSGHISAYEHFEARFGAALGSEHISVVCFLLTQLRYSCWE